MAAVWVSIDVRIVLFLETTNIKENWKHKTDILSVTKTEMKRLHEDEEGRELSQEVEQSQVVKQECGASARVQFCVDW